MCNVSFSVHGARLSTLKMRPEENERVHETKCWLDNAEIFGYMLREKIY